jgi:hypothetical protein
MKTWSVGGVLLRGAAGLVCSIAFLVACSDDDAVVQANDAGDGSAPAPDAAGVPGDAAPDSTADADTPCSIGHTSSAIVGDGGATVSLCGATLEVPAGALEAGASVGLAIVAPPGPPWFEHELSGPVFRLTPDDVVLDLPAKISLTRDTTKQRSPVLSRWLPLENLWGEREACPKDDKLSIQTVELGTFGLMQDVNTYPTGPDGLGSATVALSLQGQQTSWTVPGSGGYAVYEPAAEGRSLMLVARRDENGHLQNLDIRVFIPNGQPASLVQVSWIWTDPDNGTNWSYVEPVHGAPTSFALSEPTPGTFVGELHVVGHSGDETTPIDATFTTTPAKYRPPPSASCGPPEGDRALLPRW